LNPHIKRMLHAMSWAHRQTLAAVRDCPAVQTEALPLLAHMLGAEHIWLSRLRGQPATHSVWPTLTATECEQLLDENAAGYESFASGLGDHDFSAVIRYRNSKGDEFANTVIDILTHVVVHGAYHRGQVAKALGRAGVAAVSTDYITFARTVEPEGE
jgi:uncharacterized damage-inducible protein DinB